MPFLIILGVALLVRAIALDQGLWGDQVVVFRIAQLEWKELLGRVAASETHPPLSYLLLHLWLKVGSSEVWARSLFVLFGLGTCVVTYGLGRALAGRRFGLVAMGVAALLPSAVWASRYLRAYIVGAFFAGAAAWCFVRLLKGHRSPRDWALYTVLSALALQSFYFNGLVLAAQGLYGVVEGRRWRRWLGPLALSQGLAVASILPLVHTTWQTLKTTGVEIPISTRYMLLNKVGFYVGGIHIGGLIRSTAGAMGLDTLFLAGPLHRTWPRTILAAVGLLSILVAGFFIYRGCSWLNREGRGATGLAGGTWVAAMLLVPVALANLLHNLTTVAMLPHYFIPLAPFAACLGASVIESMRRRWLAASLVGLFLLFSGSRLWAIYSDEGADWRSALPHIEARWQAGDGVVFLDPTLEDGYDFYARRPVPRMGLGPLLAEAMQAGEGPPGTSAEAEEVRARLGQFQRLWFLRTEPYHFAQEETVTRWVRMRYRQVDEERFGHLVLTLLVQKPEGQFSDGVLSSSPQAEGSL